MNAPQDHDPGLLAGGGVAAVVIRNKEEILRRFCDRAQRSLPNARREPHPVIIDTLPAFITRLAMALRAIDDLEYASESSNIAVQHGDERARFTQYSLDDLLKEYQFIREILMDVLRTQSAPSAEQWRVMHRSVDEAMAEAATAFVEVHDGFREVFTASLTHDFRGPLSNARNFVELMRRATDAAQREQFALRATQNLDRIARMIAGLLDASRSNVGERLAVDAAECDVGDLLNEVLVDLEPGVRQRVELTMPEDTSAYWDRDKIHRAVQNLVDNAIKYSAPDSTVTLRAVETHGRVQIAVHNFGEPISPEDQPTLFRPFRRTATAQRSGKAGWGLGLVLVQAVAEAHGGSVGVESSATGGTTFTLDLIRDIRDLRTQ
jgi:signal transduction histidine kinase